MGRSGSGKSTLGNLLLRFYEPSVGSILIDGHPLQTIDLHWLRNNITLVQQQNVLFNESVFRNIAFGRRDHTKVKKEEVKRSIETAFLKNTLLELPEGLDTIVGAGGNVMSGGQKQRIAIARARLRDTPILILDEATSALDHISRTAVMEAIREWRRGKTTIIITHDMSHIQADDFAYVMEQGVIVQEGYKRDMEKANAELFQRKHRSEVDFPKPNVGFDFPWHRRKSSASSRMSKRSSAASRDSLTLEYQPRPFLVPSVFGSSLQDSRSDGFSSGPTPPISPAATVQMRRFSGVPSYFLQPRSL